jgi:acetyl esterase/lipase
LGRLPILFVVMLASCQREVEQESLAAVAPEVETTATDPPTTTQASFLKRRAAFKSNLTYHGPSPQEGEEEPLPDGLSLVTYPSAGRDLKAWIYVPDDGRDKHPALVYLHGGLAFGVEDFDQCQIFVDAGFVVLCTSYRGENNNPGEYELFLGEVDDAVAAIQWLAEHPAVDRDKIFAFGHSSGGLMSAMLSLFDDVPIQHSGSCGGMYGPDLFQVISNLTPFDPDDARETSMRLFVGNVAEMQRPHYAYVGVDDTLMRHRDAIQEVNQSGAALVVTEVAGDHHSSLDESMARYLKVALEASPEP